MVVKRPQGEWLRKMPLTETPDLTKFCVDCKQEKILEDFYKHPPCNVAIGNLKEDPELFSRAVAYLQYWQTGF